MTNIFEGKLVRLRAVEADDWKNHAEWDRDTEMARHLYEIPFPQSTTSTKQWAEREAQRKDTPSDNFQFEIETLDGVQVGSIGTHDCDLRNGTFSYGLATIDKYRRKGYASEAIRLLLRYFFQERRYQKCTTEVFSFNEPSQKLHESLGFTLEGRLRRMIYTNGEFHDALFYGITKEEFAAQGLRFED
ncbi:MAG: GNAT family N-acetyltransferase [Chloroflexi bacterium]|nr:GNAT family N-acetyltransferase [Chloroflexota bacterium]